MTQIKRYLETLLAGEDLTADEASAIMRAMAAGEVPDAQAGGLLCALRTKGETAEEIRGFATAMRELALRPQISAGSPTVDTVGTGGDGSGSLNLSTATGLLLAASGIRVVKHGNRSISSRCGAADFLEALGLPIPLDPQAAGRCLDATGFTFLFAPAYHPAMKNIMPVRNALGVRTVFNVLGPLTNPAAPDYLLVGAYSLPMAELMAQTLSGLPIRRAYVVHDEGGWDEAIPARPFHRFDVRPGAVEYRLCDPADAGVPRCRAEDLAGGDAAENAAVLRAVLAGERQGPVRDTLALNAGLVLEMMEKVDSLAAGVARAYEVLDAGRGRELLERLAAFSAAERAA